MIQLPVIRANPAKNHSAKVFTESTAGERRVIRACAKAARLTNRDETGKNIIKKALIYFKLEILLVLHTVAGLSFYK